MFKCYFEPVANPTKLKKQHITVIRSKKSLVGLTAEANPVKLVFSLMHGLSVFWC